MTLSNACISTMCRLLEYTGVCVLLLSGLGCVGSVSATRRALHQAGQRAEPTVVEETTTPQAVTREGVTVYYHKALSRHAERFAELFASQLSYIRATTGFAPAWEHVNIYLTVASDELARGRPLPWCDVEPRKTFLWLHFVRSDEPSWEDVIAALNYPHVVMHELVEASLAGGDDAGRGLLMDYRRKTWWGGTKDEFHYTRWFREGFASYAGVLACRPEAIGDG